MTGTPGRAASQAAQSRILDAAAQCVIREGVAAATMATIAEQGAVSKALLHYHFSDRAGLLTSVVERLGQGILTREEAALRPDVPGGPVDLLWRWLDDELRRGELRALIALGAVRDEPVRAEVARVSEARRSTATRTVERVFARLELAPRVPADLLGETVVAFTDGLALGDGHGRRDNRSSFDVFWLAMLSLGE